MARPKGITKIQQLKPHAEPSLKRTGTTLGKCVCCSVQQALVLNDGLKTEKQPMNVRSVCQTPSNLNAWLKLNPCGPPKKILMACQTESWTILVDQTQMLPAAWRPFRVFNTAPRPDGCCAVLLDVLFWKDVS